MKGQAFVYFAILVILFMVVELFNIFTPVITTIEPVVYDMVNESNATATLKDNALDALDTVGNVWVHWPLFMILGLFIWMIVASQRREPDYGYG